MTGEPEVQVIVGWTEFAPGDFRMVWQFTDVLIIVGGAYPSKAEVKKAAKELCRELDIEFMEPH